MEASKKKMKFPSAFSILFIILLIAIGLTWLIPSGSYSKLSYDTTENHFIVKTHGIPDQSYPATEQTLNQLNIKIQLSNFTNGIIKKPIAIPNTYQRIEQHEKGITDMIHGYYDFYLHTRWNDWCDKQNRSIQCRINVSHQKNERK